MNYLLAIAFLVIIVLCGAMNNPLGAEIPLDFCLDSSKDYLSQIKIHVDHYPINIMSGTKLTTIANAELIKAIEAGSKLELKLKRRGFVDARIPCLQIGNLPLPIGSCTYDGDALLRILNPCPESCPDGQGNALPLNPGHYGGNTLDLFGRDIPEIIKPLLVGDLEAEGRIFNAAGIEIICVRIVVNLI